jgi:hypothetical protein
MTDPVTGISMPSGIVCANFLSGGGAGKLYGEGESACPGLDYDSKHQQIVGWPNQGAASYVLVPHPEMSPPRVECYTQDFGGPMPLNTTTISSGTHGRFRYFPGPDAFLLLNDFTHPAYVLRTQ